jgi:hypothetical protein
MNKKTLRVSILPFISAVAVSATQNAFIFAAKKNSYLPLKFT